MLKNPVMFVTEVGAVVTTVLMFTGTQGAPFGFLLQIALWLWFTVLFANFAEAMAEGGEKRRPTLCGRRARRPSRTASRESIEKSRPSSCARKISSLSRREKSSRATARSSRAPRPWMNPPSPANPPRSCGRLERPQRRDWRHACSLTSSRFALPRIRGNFSRPDDWTGRRRETTKDTE